MASQLATSGMFSPPVSSTFALNNNKHGSLIKVAVRVRPLVDHERNQGHLCNILKANPSSHEIQIDEGNGARPKSYKFDQVFTKDNSQQDLYSGLGLSNLVTKVIEGYHGTIFAYGQTGSGKTFTMEGSDFQQGEVPGKIRAVKSSADSENVGITQRAIFDLYNQINEIKTANPTKHYSVFCSYLQVYNEKVFDLLNSGSIGTQKNQQPQQQQQGLRIRWTKKDQFIVENLYIFECQSAPEALDLFRLGGKNKVIASHNLNDMSSRSHAIFCLTVESHDLKHAVGGDSGVTVSKLQLVDLAGSEKQALTGTTGQQAKESIDINKSLLVLRKVITALTETKGAGGAINDKSGGSFIPYRESKLTSLLKQSLGGNSYTLMIACLSPSDKYIEENLSTLNYASKASQISNLPTKNIDPRLMEITDQKRKIQDLEKELRQANDNIQFLTQMNDDKAVKIQTLEAQLKQIQNQSPDLLVKAHSNILQNEIPSKLPSIAKIQQINDAKVKIELSNCEDLNNSILNSESSNTKTESSPEKQLKLQSNQSSSQRQTQLNFFLQKDKEKQEAQADRLIHSVNAVTDLLKANTELRDQMEKLKFKKEEVDGEVFGLQIENQGLRERLDLVEGILKSNRDNYDLMLSEEVKTSLAQSNTQYGKFNMQLPLCDGEQAVTSIDAVYNELIQLRHKNKALEGRIQQLEVQQFRMCNRNQDGGGKSSSAKDKNTEPNRPIFRIESDKGTPHHQSESENQILAEESDEYDDEEDNDSGPKPPSSKSRSFIVNIDEHIPKSSCTNIKMQQIQAKQPIILPSSNRNISSNQANKHPQQQIAQGHPYSKNYNPKSLYNSTYRRNRDSSKNLNPQKNPTSDPQYQTKTNFYSVNEDLMQKKNNSQNIVERYQSNKAQSLVSDYQAESQNFLVGGAVQPPLHNQKFQINSPTTTTTGASYQKQSQRQQQTYNDSDFSSSSDVFKRKQVTLKPIGDSKGLNDSELRQAQAGRKEGSAGNRRSDVPTVSVISNLMNKRQGNANDQGSKKRVTSYSQQQNNIPRKQPKFTNNNDFYI